MINDYVGSILGRYQSSIGILDNPEYYSNHLSVLNEHHLGNCAIYKQIIESIFDDNLIDLNELGATYLPVKLFKLTDLLSVSSEDVVKVLRSSGTGGMPSRIHLDKYNARNQMIALSNIFTDFTGLKRPIMLTLKNKKSLYSDTEMSARKAGLLGFGQLCKKIVFAGTETADSVDNDLISTLAKTSNEKILVFGFTSDLWESLTNVHLDDITKKIMGENAVLLHGGGWKKLAHLNISKQEFNSTVQASLGITKVINYYGMVEQTGTIFFECEYNRLHANPLATALSRNSDTLEINEKGEVGIAQVLSLIPTSYPGHSIITDDLISIYQNPCNCGRKGVSFEILGRKANAEPRGCSDAYK